MADYPSSIWAGNTRGTNLSDAETHTTWHDDVMAEVIAVETALGTSPARTLAALGTAVPATVTTWSSPVASGLTTTSGTIVASYTQVGKIVCCHFVFTFGASSAVTGDLVLTLPVTAASSGGVHGSGRFVDTGTAVYAATVASASTTTVNVRAITTSGTYGQPTALSSTVPHTWASTDLIQASMTYLAA